jgi:hypothetical protein
MKMRPTVRDIRGTTAAPRARTIVFTQVMPGALVTAVTIFKAIGEAGRGCDLLKPVRLGRQSRSDGNGDGNDGNRP